MEKGGKHPTSYGTSYGTWTIEIERDDLAMKSGDFSYNYVGSPEGQ